MVEFLREIDITPLVLPVSVALIAFIVRLTVKRDYTGVFSFLLDVIAAVFVGVMISFLIQEYEISKGTKWFIIAISAITGPDIIAGILQTGVMFSRTPVTFTLRVIRILTNNPLTAKEVEDMTEWENEIRRMGSDSRKTTRTKKKRSEEDES